MALRLRQVALVARELEPVVDDLCSVLGLEVGFRDPGVGVFGLHNAVLPVGDTFLEVVSPVREGTTAGRLLERRGGDGGYMVILQTDDLARERARVERLGVRVVWEVTLDAAAAIHLHPRDVGAAILSFDWMDPADAWRWAGPDWREHRRTDVATELAGVELQADDPARLAARWSEVLDEPARPRGSEHVIRLARGEIRFVRATDGRGEGLSGVDVRVRERERPLAAARARGGRPEADRLRLGGTHFRLV